MPCDYLLKTTYLVLIKIRIGLFVNFYYLCSKKNYYRMTDSQLILGILHNDEQVWRTIYSEMRSGFAAIISRSFAWASVSENDIEDLYHQSLIILMQKVKDGSVVTLREGALFSYLVQIGKLTMSNLLRKRRVTFSIEQHKDQGEVSIDIDEKQQLQNEFLDRVILSLPNQCRELLKYFYWERKSMEDIANILGMRNADSAKSKKSKCMMRMREIAAALIESDEFAEGAVRNAVERAALKELLEDERFYLQSGIGSAALDVDGQEDNKDKQ